MDSSEAYDPTLPINIENSLNTDFLNDLTQSHLEFPDGSVPMVAKSNSGRLSPIRSRTMKEYETQIGELKKENFSLKLRIYYLDERMQQKFGDDDVFKTNIELKVELDSVKKELSDKQEILKKASVAMQNLTHTHQEEMAQLRQQHQAALRSIQAPLERQLQASQQELYLSKKELETAEARIKSMEGELCMYERQRQDADSGKDIQEKQAAETQKLVDQMKVTLKAKTARIGQLQAEVTSFEETTAKLKDTMKDLEAQLQRKQQELEDELAEKNEKSKDLEKELGKTKADLETAQEQLGNLEDSLRKKDKSIKDLENELKRKEEELETQTVMGTKLKKTVQAITMELRKKVKEASDLCSQLEKKEDELKQAREELHALNLERLEGIEKQHVGLGNELTLEKLKAELKEIKHENERLRRSLTQREGETSSFKDLLTKAEQGLKHSEEAVQVLQDQLEKERERCTDKLESQTQHYQALLGDSQRQLENKERMLQQMTESLKDKDRQLQDCMTLIKPATTEESKDNLLKKFQEKLKERDKAIEEAIEDKFKCLEEKDKEIRDMKITLRERDRDIERANQMLLNAEESIDSLENEIREKDKSIKQLSNQLRSAQKGGEDTQDNYTRSLEEKDAIIKRLQNAISAKDKALEEAAKMSPDIDNVKLHQLQQRVAEKDKLMAELMEERNQAAQSYEASMKESHRKLKDKENEIKQMSEAHNEEVSTLAKDLHRLQSDLNKKDFELQTLENRATWAEDQQQDMLDKMRHALLEKDKTIEALVESGKEKDKLFRQMQGSQSLDQSQTAARLAELQNLKEELALLQNDLHNKDDLIERLKKMNNEQKSNPCEHTSTREIHKHIERVVEEQNNETRRLNEALQNERQIYINLNTSDPHRSCDLDAELAAVKSLRTELEAGVERNNQLRSTLEGQLKDAQSHTVTALKLIALFSCAVVVAADSRDDAINLKEQIELLRTELEESKRLNASLQSCLQENQKLRANGVGRDVTPDISVNSYSFAEPSSLHLDESLLDVLSSDDLKKTVKNLHEQLSEGQRLNISLKTQLAATETFRDVPGENNTDSSYKLDDSIVKLKRELCECKETLNRTEAENRGFRFKFGLVPDEQIILDDLPNVDELQAELLVMKTTLESIENVNNKLKQQLQVTGKGENVQSGLNPDLVEQMVKEIEELKAELTCAKQELEHKGKNICSDSVLSSVKHVEGQTCLKVKPCKSQIPRLQVLNIPRTTGKGSSNTNTNTNSSQPAKSAVYKRPVTVIVPDIDSVDLSEPDRMHTLIRQYRQDLVGLQNKLTSTEATVRTQGRRCRYYKALLDNAGLLPTAPYRSQSESCLFDCNATVEEAVTVSGGAEQAIDARSESLHSGIGQLHVGETVKSLQRLLEEKEAVIKSLKGKVESISSSTSPLGTPANRSSPVPMDMDNQTLQRQVNSLQKQLADAQKVNKTLLKTLQHCQQATSSGISNVCASSQTSPVASPGSRAPVHIDGSALLEKDRVICNLRKQLAESQNICTQLSSQLEDLGQLVLEYIQKDESNAGGEAVANSCPREGDYLLQTLNTTQDLVKDLSTLLDVPDKTADGGVNSLQEMFGLQNKYEKALHEIQTLKRELVKTRQEEQRKLLADREQQEAVTQGLREELRSQECVVEAQNQEIDRLQNYTEQKNLEVSKLQNQVRSLQELTSNLQAMNISTRSAAVGESCEADNASLFYPSYNNNRETETESVYSDESWDALEREGYRPVGSTSNAKSRGKFPAYPDTDSMDSDDVDARSARPRPMRNRSGIQKLNSQAELSIERARHRTASGLGQRSATRGSTEGFALGEESTSSSVPSDVQGKPSTNNGFMSLSSSEKTEDGLWASQNSRELFVQNGDSVTSSQRSRGKRAELVNFGLLKETDHTYPAVPIPDIDRYSLSGLDSDSHSTRDSKSHSILRSAAAELDDSVIPVKECANQIDLLTSKLKSAEVVNQTLKDELKIYQNIRTSIGIGPGLLTPTRVSLGMGTQTSMIAEDSDTALLQEHLAEIRAMRIRLEASLNQNDHLRTQLERRLQDEGSSHSGPSPVAVHMTGHSADKMNISQQLLHEKVIFIQSQLVERERILKEKLTIIQTHESVIREKNHKIEQQRQALKQQEKQLTEKDNMCKKLQHQHNKLSVELKSANKEVHKLKQEKNQLNQQLQENEDLNKTLRFELEMYESMHAERSEDSGSRKKGFDIRELMTEVRRLRVQLERCIDTNNSLRQKLEERLRQDSPRSHHGGGINMVHQGHSTDGSRHGSKEASDGMPSPDAHTRYLNSHSCTTERYVGEQETLSKSQGSQHSSQGSQYSSQNGSQGSQNGSYGNCSGVPAPRLNLPYGSSVELNRSGHSSDGSGHLVSGFDTLGSQHSQSSEERDALIGTLHSPHGLSRTWPNSGRGYDLGMSLLSATSLPGGPLSASMHQRSLSVRHASEGNMTYHVYDPPSSFVDVFPVGVDPDIRHLFAVGKVDDYEHLKKENNECRRVLSGIQARIAERLSRFKSMSPSQSIEYSTLKELSLSVENLRMCLSEENRLITSFWVTQLPACDDKGEFYSSKVLEKNDHLQSELYMLRLKYNLLASAAKDAQTRLHATNRQKEDIEEAVIQQLSRTEKVLRHARGNLETKAKAANRSKTNGKQSSSSANSFS
ncbi:myomegalin-like [Liolophura sinensis]|uniref:myomegalin-like n=1 Tax=Liolophura sinensis TaxID=3198878 RepID=UPI003158A09E